MTGEPQRALCDLLSNAALAGGSSQIFSPTPMITQGPLKGKGALRNKINTISKRVLKSPCVPWLMKTIDYLIYLDKENLKRKDDKR